MRLWMRSSLAVLAALATAAMARAQSDTGMHGGAMKDGMSHNAMGMGHSAEFMKGAKSVTGTCMIVEDQGQHALTFSDDFSIENSPTPYVVLSTSTRALGDSPVWLGAVQHARGTQRYVIPKDADLAHYTHVVIWDKTTKAVLANADLPSGGAMSGM